MKKNKNLTIQLPTPCGEKWDEMSKTDAGRFCASCQHEVIDFSGMTDAEIMRTFMLAKEKPCGRFRSTQLNRPFEQADAQDDRKWPRLALGALLLMIASPMMLQAQAPLTRPQIHQTQEVSNPTTSSPELEKNCPDPEYWVTIHVLDFNVKRPIPFSIVQIVELNDTIKAEQDGIVRFHIAPEFQNKPLTLVVSAREYLPVTISITAEGKAIDLEVPIKLEPIITMGIPITYFTRKEWRKFKKENKEFLRENDIEKWPKRPRKVDY